MKKIVFLKLGIMMFMQFMLFAVWWVPFAAYLNSITHLGSFQVSLILCSMAFGSIASPLVGMIADRYVSSEKLLTGLNLLVAFFLFLATRQTHFTGIMITVTLVMLCYMPSWSLTSSIAMTHISSEQFPRLRLIGSLGWAASGLFSMAAIHLIKTPIFDGTIYPLYCGVATAVVAAFFNLFLPKTPPSGKKSTKTSIADIFGLRVIATLKNKNFNRFVILTFLSLLPFCLYYTYGAIFFSDIHVKNITVTMNWGQVAEMFFLFITTSILIKYGVKKALFFGLLALIVRYLSFYIGFEIGQQWLYSIGIISHGLIFGLFYIVGQVYADKIAPPELKAQAQGFLSFITWGVGLLAGTLFNGWMIGHFKVDGQTDWSFLFLIATISTIVLTVLFMLFFKNSSTDKNNL